MTDDLFYEQLLSRKPRPADALIRIAAILFIAVLIIGGFPFISIFAILLAAIAIFVEVKFLFPRLKVEYEYCLVNHDMDISAIYNKESRRQLLSFSLKDVEMAAPKTSLRMAHTLSSFPVKDYSSDPKSNASYALAVSGEKSRFCVILEPDERMLESLRYCIGPTKFYTD